MNLHIKLLIYFRCSTCHRFNDIVESGYKFKSVYMICDGFHRPHKYYLNFLNGTTERIKIRCTNKNFNESTTHEKCMNKIVFRNLLGLTKNLKTLEIINHNIEVSFLYYFFFFLNRVIAMGNRSNKLINLIRV